ncbi:MAG: hypothetical protein SNH27_13720 [Rikenellaceae bacterium]
MVTEFDMKGGYKVIDNAILIDSTPAGVSLYNKSKEIISQNAKSIDSNVSLIKMCDILLQLIDSAEKEKTEFAQNIRNYSRPINSTISHIKTTQILEIQ